MKKGGQQIPQAKSKAKARASSRATTSEGAGAAPDTSPPRLPARKTARGVHEGRNDGTLQCWSGGTNFGLSLTPSLPLDNVAWPLRKDDGVSSSGHCCTALFKDGVTLDIAA